MPTDKYAKYITGSDLLTGEVVFRAADGTWMDQLSSAELIIDPELGALKLRDAEQNAPRVVGPYLADAAPDAPHPTPVHYRERFRATGPSNYPHGKQERHRHV